MENRHNINNKTFGIKIRSQLKRHLERWVPLLIAKFPDPQFLVLPAVVWNVLISINRNTAHMNELCYFRAVAYFKTFSILIGIFRFYLLKTIIRIQIVSFHVSCLQRRFYLGKDAR